MALQEKILAYLSAYGSENRYKLARALKEDVAEVTKVLDLLEQEGRIEIKEGKAMIVKGEKSIITKKIPIEEEKPSEDEEERVKGTVKFFNQNKGFGFIAGDDGKEYYVHKSGLKEGIAIEANDRVSFKAAQGDKGPKAEDVEKIS